MGLRWMILPVLLLCAEATDRHEAAAPGHNATLTCSGNISDVYWYVEVRSQVKGLLVRTFGVDPKDATYSVDTTLKNKYMLVRNQLVISNVSAEDYRPYFCGRKNNGVIVFTDTFQLVPNVSTPLTNYSEETQQQYSCRLFQSELIVYGSLALNVVFMVVGLVLAALCLKKICSRQVNEPLPFTSETPEPLEGPQYEEIQLRAPPPAAPYSMECIYHKAQLPGSPLPPHH